VAEDLKRARYQLERAIATDDPSERFSRQSDSKNAGHAWKLSDRLSEDDVAAIVAAWKAGTPRRKIAENFGISQASVHRLLVENDEQHGNPNQVRRIADRFSPEKVQEIVNAYRDGMKQREVVVHYGISASALKRLLRERGVRKNDR